MLSRDIDKFKYDKLSYLLSQSIDKGTGYETELSKLDMVSSALSMEYSLIGTDYTPLDEIIAIDLSEEFAKFSATCNWFIDKELRNETPNGNIYHQFCPSLFRYIIEYGWGFVFTDDLDVNQYEHEEHLVSAIDEYARALYTNEVDYTLLSEFVGHNFETINEILISICYKRDFSLGIRNTFPVLWKYNGSKYVLIVREVMVTYEPD